MAAARKNKKPAPLTIKKYFLMKKDITNFSAQTAIGLSAS
jgi:hypothetical protein